MEIETRQRIKYLLEHGGLWEPQTNQQVHVWLLAGVALMVILELFEIVEAFLLR